MLRSITTYQKTSHITKREKEVLYLISQEYTNRQISQMLYISLNTVHTHRKKIISKLQVKNTAGIIRKSFELGILPMPKPEYIYNSKSRVI